MDDVSQPPALSEMQELEKASRADNTKSKQDEAKAKADKAKEEKA